jgi:GTP1/Obg family GTP-binding protein
MANQQDKVRKVHFGRLGTLFQKLSTLLQKLSLLFQKLSNLKKRRIFMRRFFQVVKYNWGHF